MRKSGAGEAVTFSFGVNWQRFLTGLNESHIAGARRSFTQFTRLPTLEEHTFLDIGCGSGLSSLVAYQLGARRVVSVDLDPASVSCTHEVRRRFAGDTARWEVLQGSALDEAFLSSLGRFSYVYSWGVLHHTGAMWTGLDLVARCVEPAGRLHVAVYNEHKNSPAWLRVKRACNRWPRSVFPAVKASYALLACGKRLARLESPLEFAGRYRERRGMDFWRDVDDWLCGLPYEYCKPECVIDFLLARHFTLLRLGTAGSTGCNEFLFRAARDGTESG